MTVEWTSTPTHKQEHGNSALSLHNLDGWFGSLHELHKAIWKLSLHPSYSISTIFLTCHCADYSVGLSCAVEWSQDSSGYRTSGFAFISVHLVAERWQWGLAHKPWILTRLQGALGIFENWNVSTWQPNCPLQNMTILLNVTERTSTERDVKKPFFSLYWDMRLVCWCFTPLRAKSGVYASMAKAAAHCPV